MSYWSEISPSPINDIGNARNGSRRHRDTKKYFRPVRIKERERLDFFTIRQTTQETVDRGTERIRQAATKCEFGSLEEELKFTELVLAIKCGRIRERLSEHGRRFTFSETTEKARECEKTNATVIPTHLRVIEPNIVTCRVTRCLDCGTPHRRGTVLCRANGCRCYKCGKFDHFENSASVRR